MILLAQVSATQLRSECIRRGFFPMRMSVKMLDSQRSPPIDKEGIRYRTQKELEFFEFFLGNKTAEAAEHMQELLVELALTNFQPLSSGIWVPTDRKGKVVLHDFSVSKLGKLFLVARAGWTHDVYDEHFDGSLVWVEWRKKIGRKRKAKR